MHRRIKKNVKPSENPCLLLSLSWRNSFPDSIAPPLVLTYGEMHWHTVRTLHFCNFIYVNFSPLSFSSNSHNLKIWIEVQKISYLKLKLYPSTVNEFVSIIYCFLMGWVAKKLWSSLIYWSILSCIFYFLFSYNSNVAFFLNAVFTKCLNLLNNLIPLNHYF